MDRQTFAPAPVAKRRTNQRIRSAVIVRILIADDHAVFSGFLGANIRALLASV
jgi:hypothetical protein